MEADKDGKLCRAPPERRGSGIFHLLYINLHLHTLCKKTCADVRSVTKHLFIVACQLNTHTSYNTCRNECTYASLGSSGRGCRECGFASQTLRSNDSQIVILHLIVLVERNTMILYHNKYGQYKDLICINTLDQVQRVEGITDTEELMVAGWSSIPIFYNSSPSPPYLPPCALPTVP